jgi:hypothetical protein
MVLSRAFLSWSCGRGDETRCVMAFVRLPAA